MTAPDRGAAVSPDDPSQGHDGAAVAPAVDVLPVMGTLSNKLWRAVADGQPVLLTRGGRPAAVILDIDSYAEVELSLDGG